MEATFHLELSVRLRLWDIWAGGIPDFKSPNTDPKKVGLFSDQIPHQLVHILGLHPEQDVVMIETFRPALSVASQTA